MFACLCLPACLPVSAVGYCIAALDFVSTEVFGESVLSLMIVLQLKRELDVFQQGQSDIPLQHWIFFTRGLRTMHIEFDDRTHRMPSGA